MLLREITNEEFNQFTLNFNQKSIYQTSEYAFVMNEQNFDSIFLGLEDENKMIIAASLVLIENSNGFKYAYAPRGFLLDYDNQDLFKTFTKLIKNYLKRIKVMGIKINPIIYKEKRNNKNEIIYDNNNFKNIMALFKKNKYYHLGFNNSFEALKPRFEAIIPLNKNYVDIFKNLPKQLKTKIRSAEKNGIVIHKGNKNNLNILYEQTRKKYPRGLKYFEDCYNFFNNNKRAEFYYAKIDTKVFLNRARLDYQNLFDEYTKINDELLRTNNSRLINKKMESDKTINMAKNDLISATKLNHDFPDGIVLASVIVIKHGNTATLLIDGYDPKYKIFNAKHLLIWKLMELFSKEGIEEFNLGGINNPDKPIEKYKGLTEFKLSFGAESVEYIGDFELITNRIIYMLYRDTSPLRKIFKKKKK